MKLGLFNTVTDSDGYYVPLVKPNEENAKIDPNNLISSSFVELTGQLSDVQTIFDNAIIEGKKLFYIHDVIGYGGSQNAGLVLDQAIKIFNTTGISFIGIDKEINYFRVNSDLSQFFQEPGFLNLSFINCSQRLYFDGGAPSTNISGVFNSSTFAYKSTSTNIVYNSVKCNSINNLPSDNGLTSLTVTNNSIVGFLDIQDTNVLPVIESSNINKIKITGIINNFSKIENTKINFVDQMTVNSTVYDKSSFYSVDWDLTTNPTEVYFFQTTLNTLN